MSSKSGMMKKTPDARVHVEIVLQVRSVGSNVKLSPEDTSHMKSGQLLIGMCNPLGEAEMMKPVAEKGVTSFSLELLPRAALLCNRQL